MAQLSPADSDSLLNSVMEEGTPWQQPPRDLDAFFQGLYAYHSAHGLAGMVLNEVHDWLLHVGILIFVYVMFGCIDWSSMMSSGHEVAVEDYVHRPYVLFTAIWSMLLVLYVVWRVVCLRHLIPQWRTSHQFFTKDLTNVQHKSWTEVVGELIAVHHQRHRILIANSLTMTPIDVAGRVLRRENYLVALAEQGALQTEPTDVVVWFAWWVILGAMFDPHQPWRLTLTAGGLRRRAEIALGVLLLLFPLILLLRVVYFGLRAAERAASPKRTFAPRRWSVSTRWHVREFNEYPHSLRRRLSMASRDAQCYLDLVPHPWTRRFLALGSFWAGSVVGGITLLTALHEDALTQMHLWDHNLLWWLALWSGIFACLRHLKPSGTESDPDALRSAEERVRSILRLGQCDIHRMFPLFAVEWFWSVVSLLRMPGTLWTWREDAEAIVSTIEVMTSFDTRLGDICSASLMATLPEQKQNQDSGMFGPKYDRSFHAFSDMYASVWDLQASLTPPL